jgi:hypothetical protein
MMKKPSVGVMLALLGISWCAAQESGNRMQYLRVSDNGRFLMREDGTPFFWMGDTAWKLTTCSKETIDRYVQDCAENGFSVIQVVVQGCDDNSGTKEFLNRNPTTPNEQWFADRVDYVVGKAQEAGIYVALLPTWGGTVADSGAFFTASNARAYGEWIGARYRDRKHVVYMIGGDRPPHRYKGVDNNGGQAVWRAMAEGIKADSRNAQLVSYHTSMGPSAGQWFQNESWFDFNSTQTGQALWGGMFEGISQAYALMPTKPLLDSEPLYENHPVDMKPTRSNAYDVRTRAYWAVFHGAFGHTYGTWGQFNTEPAFLADLDLSGRLQMKHLRALMESRPQLTRVPDQTLIISVDGARNPGQWPHPGYFGHVAATRDTDGSYVMAYTGRGLRFVVDLEKMSGNTIRGHWFNPRTGKATVLGEFPRAETREFVPPTSGDDNDWVLVLDDLSRRYPMP